MIDRPLLLRNCALEHLAGSAIDEGKADVDGALTQAANDALAVLDIVRYVLVYRFPWDVGGVTAASD